MHVQGGGWSLLRSGGSRACPPWNGSTKSSRVENTGAASAPLSPLPPLWLPCLPFYLVRFVMAEEIKHQRE